MERPGPNGSSEGRASLLPDYISFADYYRHTGFGWQKLVSRHPNFVLVISGHVGVAAYLKSKGVNGNTVHQLVVDYQDIQNGGNAWLRLLQFLPDGKTVRVRDYTPLLDQTAKLPERAFEFVLDPP
jgi:hypothetical protein